MKQSPTSTFTIVLLILLSFLSNASFAQTLGVDAGENQIINWDKTKTAMLTGKFLSGDAKAEWSSPYNSTVKFKNADKLESEVTFTRPGYYLLELSAISEDGEKVSDNVVINVFKENSYELRLDDLVGLMTLYEKIHQLANESDAIPRLGIPKYNYWSEALHGVVDDGATSFPQAIALGSSWDPDLVFRIASTISDEARVKNKIKGKGLSYWSPTVNITRDPRWGRNEESYGEDPLLLSEMGLAFVKGMQGNHPYYLKTVSTPKHFIANNEEGRRHKGSSDVDMRSLWEYYLPAFQKLITEGKAYSIMSAYNSLNNVPSSANMYLLTDLLRRQWGFGGYVVSDCGAIDDILNDHHFVDSGAEAVARGILAGCDLNCGSFYPRFLADAYEQGLIEEKDIDRAVKRVLSARFRLGEFDPPEVVPYNSIPVESLDSKENRELALEAARKSIVLLKNEENILPLKKDEIKSIAVIGPNAAELELGLYSNEPNIKISPLEGIKKKAEAAGIRVQYAKGSDLGGGLLVPIETKYFTEVDGTGKTGMKGEFFGNMDLSGEPLATRIDSMVYFDFGTNPPAEDVPADSFSCRWTGKIIPPEPIHILGTRTDDGARLYLDGKLLFDDWNKHGEKPNNAEVNLEAGKEYELVFEHYDERKGADAKLMWDLTQMDFHKTQEVAANNDLVILVLGISPKLSAEGLDRQEIELPELQKQLVEAVAKVNENIIIVLCNGGPIALGETEDYAKGIVEAWYSGELGGTAIADILFGDVNPGGKLPQTFYASTDQLPPFADYDLINNERTYMYFDKHVLYPFGYGLSYTTFDFSGLELSANKISEEGTIEVKCKVKNTGERAGDEVVQIYVKDMEASVKVPKHKLQAFKRVSLEPGEEKEVNFSIPASQLAYYDIESNGFIVEPGKFEIQVGNSSVDIKLKQMFEIERN